GGWEPLWARSLACADELCALAQGYAGAVPDDPARAEVAAWAGLLRDDLRSHARDWTAWTRPRRPRPLGRGR
ncbi:hypothetical protein, partial [Methylomagnum ishizawai]|uniref:hypothetical protein n=1 Tax=Methylomagnum ishizawai TaxID=1760988 RepID=UPI0020CB67AE